MSDTARSPHTRGFLVNAAGESADFLFNAYSGSSCFLVCGGPSIDEQPLELLDNRGILVAAVNQSGATHVRPQLWFSVDIPSHFHEAIWSDPGIMKFARIDRATNSTARETKPGKWGHTGTPSNAYPNTWYFRHSNSFSAANFLTHARPIWGGQGMLGGKPRETRSVLLVALRILFWLGVRTVYLVGCDFRMTPERSYAFDQTKDQTACDYNNNSYRVLAGWLGELRPHFEQHGFQVLNATAGGELEAFERIDFVEAVERSLDGFPCVGTVAGHYQS